MFSLNKIAEYHSQTILKSNSLIATPNAWNRFNGCRYSRLNVLSLIFPNTMMLGASSSSSMLQESSTKIKFLIEAALTLPPKFKEKDLRR